MVICIASNVLAAQLSLDPIAPMTVPSAPYVPARHAKPFCEVRKSAGFAIERYDMIRDGDRVLVGLSGGVDSLVLMHVLEDLRRRAPIRFRLFAVTVDMGFAGFNWPALQAICEAQGWEYRRICFPGRRMLAEKGLEDAPCSLCSRMRRGQLHHMADRLNCTRIALAQHLDDLCVSFLLSLFRGGGLKTMAPTAAADHRTKRIIRPLFRVPKSRILEAADALGVKPLKACEFIDQLDASGDRAFLTRLVHDLEPRFQDIRQCMATSMANVCTEHLLDTRFPPAPIPQEPQ